MCGLFEEQKKKSFLRSTMRRTPVCVRRRIILWFSSGVGSLSRLRLWTTGVVKHSYGWLAYAGGARQDTCIKWRGKMVTVIGTSSPVGGTVRKIMQSEKRTFLTDDLKTITCSIELNIRSIKMNIYSNQVNNHFN